MLEGFPYKKPRIGQLETALEIAKAVREHTVFSLQAPTGFGKTVSILYGLVRSGKPETLYIVRTRNELTQPFREAKRLGIKPVFLYSKKAMCPLLAGDEELGIIDFWENCRLLRKRHLCPYYENIHSVSKDTLWDTLLSTEIPFDSVKKLSRKDLCPYYSLKTLIDEADLVITTYPYVFNPYIRETLVGEEGLKDYVLVIDEAHSLQNIADLVERTLSENKIMWAYNEIRHYTGYDEPLDKLASLLEYVGRMRCGRGYTYVDKRELSSILGNPLEWFDLAQEIRSRKIESLADPERTARIRIHTLSIAYFTGSIEQEGYEAFLATREGNSGTYKVLTLKPIDPSIAVKDVFENAKAIILSSGTLPPPDYYRDVLGINRSIVYYDVEEIHGPVFPPENRIALVLTYVTSKYTKRSRTIYNIYADIVEALWNNLGNGVFLVVYPSYEFMNNVISSIRGEIDMIVERENTTISTVLEVTREKRKLVVNSVAGGKLTEGIELRSRSGESLVKVVLVAGIPYPLPDDYLELSRKNLAARVGEDKAWSHLFFDVATTRVRQALGRAIRSPQDRALFILADHRYMDPRILRRLKIKVNKVIVSHREFIRVLRLVKNYIS
ncbi:MAG: ATP-dependent DNA helicase [Desulfurococcales archaeon]|nr:ATP-dependent DNA helicase [Desulfurococcales archaeon]